MYGCKTILVALVAFCLASPAVAGCRVEYKAKQDNPLRLDYGVATLPDSGCGSKAAAASRLAPKLANQGWTLLAIVSIVTDKANSTNGDSKAGGNSKPKK